MTGLPGPIQALHSGMVVRRFLDRLPPHLATDARVIAALESYDFHLRRMHDQKVRDFHNHCVRIADNVLETLGVWKAFQKENELSKASDAEELARLVAGRVVRLALKSHSAKKTKRKAKSR